MSGFENFDLRTWIVDGLTRHIQQVSGRRSEKGHRGPSRVSSLVAAFAVSALMASVTVGSMLQTPPIVSAPQVDHRAAPSLDLISGSPALFWAGVRQEVQSWKPIENALFVDAPPFV